MQALEIQFTFASAVSPPDTPTHLDGLLAYAMVQRRLLDEPDVADVALLGEDLPLAKLQQDSEWAWHASMLHFIPAGDAYLQFATRRTDAQRLVGMLAEGGVEGMRGAQLDLGSGRLRNFAWYYPLQQMSRAVAYAVGDKDAVEDLLQDIKAIGKKHQQGNGLVAGVTVAAASTPEEDEQFRTQAMRRFLPFPLDGYAPIQGACKAPYWRNDNRRIVWAPIE